VGILSAATPWQKGLFKLQSDDNTLVVSGTGNNPDDLRIATLINTSRLPGLAYRLKEARVRVGFGISYTAISLTTAYAYTIFPCGPMSPSSGGCHLWPGAGWLTDKLCHF